MAASPSELIDNKCFGFSYVNTAAARFNKDVAYIKSDILEQFAELKITSLGPTGGELFTGSITLNNFYITNEELITLLSALSIGAINGFANTSEITDISGGRFLNYWYTQTQNNEGSLKNCGANDTIDIGVNSTFNTTWDSLSDRSKAEVFLQYNTNGSYNYADSIYFYKPNTGHQGVFNHFTGFTGMNLAINLNINNQQSNYMKSYYGTLTNTQILNLPQIIKNYTLNKISKTSNNSNYQIDTINKTGT